MYTITFYSFKGVGRTLALVNVAAELAMRGRKVLLVDFDLESPALDTAARFRRLRPKPSHPGVVEYVAHYTNTSQMPPVGDYLYDAGVFGEREGRIWVMPAGGRDQDYRLGLAQLDWISLYQSHEGGEFINRMKEQWEELLHPDYVLIDCRSGHTNVEGICTRQLPDAVVMFFFPDVQNLAGLTRVCHDIVTETERGRPNPITIHFVMSNVPLSQDDGEEVSRRRRGSLNALNASDLAATLHHQEGLVTFDRSILVLDRPNARLAREYRGLVEALIVHNVEDEQGGLLFLDSMERVYSQGPVGAELVEAEERLDRFRDRHWENAPFLVRMARCLMAGRRFLDAERLLDRVLDNLQANMPEGLRPEALMQRARCRQGLNNRGDAIGDLETCLGLPNLEDGQLLSALRQLHRLAPEQFDDLSGREEVQELLRGSGPCLWELQVEGEQFEEPPPWVRQLGRLDRLRLKVLRERVQDAPEWGEMTLEQRRRQWIRDLEEYIRVLESRDGVDHFALAGAYFSLALEHWEATGRLPVDLCQQGLRHHEQLISSSSPHNDPSYRQLVALALWKTGRIPEALTEIDDAETGVTDDPEDTIYESPWRGRSDVTRDQFLEDCQQITQLIRGDPNIQPAFLREAESP